MSNEVYQCCYTNLFRYDGAIKAGGWTTTAVSRDIPPEALRMCEQFQRADSSDKATDEGGRNPLRLYEILCAEHYAYAIRTRYGMLDHMGRVNNLFSHAYVFPLDSFLRAPETLLRLNPACFEQEIRLEEFRRVEDEPNRDITELKKEESARLSERASRRLNDGVLQLPDGDRDFTFRDAMRSLGFLADRKRYEFLLKCVRARMDEKREKSGKTPPLHIQYDAAPETADLQLRRLLLCIFHGLPYSMRRELRVSNWTDIDNAPKDLMFTTQDVKSLLSGKDGAYLILKTGETNLEKRRLKKVERAHGYLSDAAKLEPERIPEFFAGLDDCAKKLGDPDASNDRIRKLAWPLFWDGANFRDEPNLEKFAGDDAQLKSLMNDIVNGGVYSAALKALLDQIGKFVPDETLTESLRNAVKAWRAEYASRLQSDEPAPSAQAEPREASAQAEPPTVPPESGTHTPPVSAPDPYDDIYGALTGADGYGGASVHSDAFRALQETITDVQQRLDAQQAELRRREAELDRKQAEQEAEYQRRQEALRRRDAQRQSELAQRKTPSENLPKPAYGANAPLLKNWDSVELAWMKLNKSNQSAIEKKLRKLLSSGAASTAAMQFRNQVAEQDRDLYLLLLMNNDKRVTTGKINAHAVVREYCFNRMNEPKRDALQERWDALFYACSILQKMDDARLTQRVSEEAWDLFERESRPNAPDRRAVSALKNYEGVLSLLYPCDEENEYKNTRNNAIMDNGKRKARERYWEKIEAPGLQWQYFSFDAFSEYEAFGDGKSHLFPDFIRMARLFRPDREAAFLEYVHAFFQRPDMANYDDDAKRNVTLILFKDLQSRYRLLLDEYQTWLNIAALTNAKENARSVWDLYAALHPFRPAQLAECYPEFNEAHRASGENKIRKRGYQFVLTACMENDANQTVPLDLWLRLGLQEVSFQTFSKKRGNDMTNAFEILEIAQPKILNMAAEDVVKESRLMNEALVQNYAEAYVKNFNKDRKVRSSVQNWLKEVGRRKKILGIF